MKDKNSLSYKLYGENAINKIQAKLDLLGYKNTYTATRYLNIKYLSSIFIFFMILYITDAGFIWAPIVTLLYFFLYPKLTIDNKIAKRKEVLDNDALYFFEVLTLSLESGRSLKNALEVTSNNIDSELSLEFRYALDTMKYGKSLSEALNDLKKKIPSDTINNIILNAEQSNIFGSSIIETMHNQIEYIRDKQIMDTKAKINKIPIKISVISVLFFIPLIMLLLLGPVIINLIGG